MIYDPDNMSNSVTFYNEFTDLIGINYYLSSN